MANGEKLWAKLVCACTCCNDLAQAAAEFADASRANNHEDERKHRERYMEILSKHITDHEPSSPPATAAPLTFQQTNCPKCGHRFAAEVHLGESGATAGTARELAEQILNLARQGHERGLELREHKVTEMIDRYAAYWQSRAKTAELKVLTFHEEIAKLRQELDAWKGLHEDAFAKWDQAAKDRDTEREARERAEGALRGMLELESHTHRLPGTVNAEWVAGIVGDAKEALAALKSSQKEGKL